MPTVILDDVQSATYEIVGQTGLMRRQTRGFTITDLSYNDASDSAGLIHTVMNVAGMPQPGDALRKTDGTVVNSAFKVSRILIRGLLPNAVRGEIVYQNYVEGVIPSTLVVTRSKRTGIYQTNIHPVTRRPIRVKWTAEAQTEDDFFLPEAPADFITMSFRMTQSAIRVSGVFYGNPATQSGTGISGAGNASGDKLGYVNSDRWQGRDPGHWLFDEFDTTHYVYQGYYTVNAVAITKGPPPLDWSETGILISQMTGRYVPVDPNEVERVNRLPYAMSDDIGGNAMTKGFVRVGPSPMTSFSQIFGDF